MSKQWLTKARCTTRRPTISERHEHYFVVGAIDAWCDCGADPFDYIEELERERDEARKVLAEEARGYPCNDPGHDDRWCPTCTLIDDIADWIEDGPRKENT